MNYSTTKKFIFSKIPKKIYINVLKNYAGQYEESMTYLCGHFHTLGGTVPSMYSLQQAGFLELELADWKDNRMWVQRIV